MKLLKRLWPIPVLFIVSALMVRACAQMIPFNIEPERVRPQVKIELPKVQTVPDAVDYFFEPSAGEIRSGDPYPMVHMRIPKAPYFEKTAKSGPHREYSLYIPMFYPNFSGMADDENAGCRGIAGHCRRELTVGIEYITPMAPVFWAYELLQEHLERGYIQPTSEISKYEGLDLVATEGTGTAKYTYYFPSDPLERTKYVIHCSEYVPSPACDVHFRSEKSPYISIRLDFVLSLLPQWKKVIEATRSKVDSMIIQTYQLQTKGQ